MQETNFEYIVVGAGSAGCIIAARLANAGHSVLLLEAGDKAENHPETLSADGFKYCFANNALMHDRMSSRQTFCAKRAIYTGTGKGMGGSGSVNGMVYTPGDKHDFDQWPKGWQWADVAPVFKRLEDTLEVHTRQGTAFTETLLQAAQSIDLKEKHALTDGDLNGFIGYNAMNFKADVRQSSYVAFLKGQNFDCLTIEHHSRVEKIIFHNQCAVAVQYTKQGEKITASATAEIILSAGALETPKLLMLSGIGPKAELEKLAIDVLLDAPAIGQNLQDHPNVCLFAKGQRPIDFAYPQVYGFKRMNPASNLPSAQPDTCLAMLAAPKTLQQSMYRMLPAVLLPPALFKKPVFKKAFRPLINLAFSLPPIKKLISHTYGFVVILGKPYSRGSVTLASNNSHDDAIINPNYYADVRDFDTVKNAVKQIQNLSLSPPLKDWGCRFLSRKLRSNKEAALDSWIKSATMTTFHFCGTCAMGEDDSYPVTPDLRLKGIKNLRIADASAIPVIPVSALNAPTMMLAMRAADFILQPSNGNSDE